MPPPDVEFLLVAVAVMAGTAGLCFAGSAVARRASEARPRLPPWPAQAALLCALSASWYTVSMSLTLFNRLLLGYLAKVAFPVSMSISHMAVKGLVAVAVLLLSGGGGGGGGVGGGVCSRPSSRIAALVRSQQLSRGVVWRILVPLGAATALDVWLSAVSISLVDVYVYTVAKSSAIVFTLLFSLAMGLQRLTLAIAASMVAIVAGVVLCSLPGGSGGGGGGGSPGVDPFGVAAALAAAACGAGRWVLTERYFSRPGIGPARPLVLIALLAPITVATLLPGLAWEVPRLAAAPEPLVSTSGEAALLAAALLGGGVLAFTLLVVELQLVARTSALTLNVIGHAKDVFVIGLAIPIFHETLTPASTAGVVLTAAGTAAYSALKARAHARAAEAAHAAGVAAAAAAMSGGFSWLPRGGGGRAAGAASGSDDGDGTAAEDGEALELLQERRQLTGGSSGAVGGDGSPGGGGTGGGGLLAAVLGGRGAARVTRESAERALQRVDLDFADSDGDDEDELDGDEDSHRQHDGDGGGDGDDGDDGGDALGRELDAAYSAGQRSR